MVAGIVVIVRRIRFVFDRNNLGDIEREKIKKQKRWKLFILGENRRKKFVITNTAANKMSLGWDKIADGRKRKTMHSMLDFICVMYKESDRNNLFYVSCYQAV